LPGYSPQAKQPVQQGLFHRFRNFCQTTVNGGLYGFYPQAPCGIFRNSGHLLPVHSSTAGSGGLFEEHMVREFGYHTATFASATNASRIGGSDSVLSRPKVSIWNLTAHVTSSKAASYPKDFSLLGDFFL
jgi:hypothetical protein